MGYHEHGVPHVCQSVHQFGYVASCLRVKVAGRFIGQNQVRSVEEGACYHYALLFSTAQGVWHFIAFLLHTYQAEYFFYSVVDFGAAFPACRAKHESEIIGYAAVLKELEVLKYNSYTAAKRSNLTAPDGTHILPEYEGVTFFDR